MIEFSRGSQFCHFGLLSLVFLAMACTTNPTPNPASPNQFPERPPVRVKPMLQGNVDEQLPVQTAGPINVKSPDSGKAFKLGWAFYLDR